MKYFLAFLMPLFLMCPDAAFSQTARSQGCDVTMIYLRLCCWNNGGKVPCRGAAALLNKNYTFCSGETLTLPVMFGAGEGPYAREIAACGQNPNFANLKDPVLSCDKTAQDIIRFHAWQSANPAPSSDSEWCGNGGCYANKDGKRIAISREEYLAGQRSYQNYYNFIAWEQKYRAGEYGPVTSSCNNSNSGADGAGAPNPFRPFTAPGKGRPQGAPNSHNSRNSPAPHGAVIGGDFLKGAAGRQDSSSEEGEGGSGDAGE